jgi:hypothetical protein
LTLLAAAFGIFVIGMMIGHTSVGAYLLRFLGKS